MKSYDSHPDVPVWLTALDGQLLTRTELDVLNFIFWCAKHGCRTSNDRIGMFTHHSHATIQRAVLKLYKMDLIAIENYGKRTRTLKGVHWPDRESWGKYKRLQQKIETDAAHHAPHIPLLDETHPTGVSSRGCSEPPKTGGRFSTSEPTVPNLPRCSVREGGTAYQLRARLARDKLIESGFSKAIANRKIRMKYPKALFEEYWNSGTATKPNRNRLR